MKRKQKLLGVIWICRDIFVVSYSSGFAALNHRRSPKWSISIIYGPSWLSIPPRWMVCPLLGFFQLFNDAINPLVNLTDLFPDLP